MELAADATAMRRSPADGAALPRRSLTRQGKARLLTLGSLDARTAAAKEARNLVTAIVEDLGGEDQLSAGQRQLATRAALVGAIVSDFEARWVAGEQVALSDYLSAVNVQRRVLATLGLERRPREVGGTIGDLMRLAAETPAEPGESDDSHSAMAADGPDAVEATQQRQGSKTESALTVESARGIPKSVDDEPADDGDDITDDWVDEE